MVEVRKAKWSSGLVTWVIGQDFVRLDDVAAELFGFGGLDANGVSIDVVFASISEAHRGRVSRLLYESIASGDTFEEEFEVKNGDTTRTLALKGQAVDDTLFTAVVRERGIRFPQGRLLEVCLEAYDIARDEDNDAAAMLLIGIFNHVGPKPAGESGDSGQFH